MPHFYISLASANPSQQVGCTPPFMPFYFWLNPKVTAVDPAAGTHQRACAFAFGLNRGRFLPLHAFIAGLVGCCLFHLSRDSFGSQQRILFYVLNNTRERNSAQRAAITADGFGPLFLILNVCDFQLRVMCFYDGCAAI